MKAIKVYVSDEVHKKLKMKAVENDTTITNILKKCIENILEEKN